jgi:hypothetical protein
MPEFDGMAGRAAAQRHLQQGETQDADGGFRREPLALHHEDGGTVGPCQARALLCNHVHDRLQAAGYRHDLSDAGDHFQ